MKRNLTNYFIPVTMLIVFLFAPRPPGIHQGYFPLFLLFGILVWQKEKIRDFLKPEQSLLTKYLLIAIIWSLWVEKVLGQQQEARYPLLIFLISLVFNIPYFLIWHKLITKFKSFTFKEVFLWSGLSGALAQTLLTSKVLGVFTDVRFIPALFMAFYNFMYIFVMFGTLTSLPFTLLFRDQVGAGDASETKKKILSLGSVFFCFAILNNFYYNFERTALITVKKTILALAVCLIIAFIFNFKLKPAYAYVHYGVGGRAWYPTRSFTGNYYGSGGLWGSYHGGNLYGPGNYGGYWWKSPTGRWWYGR